MANSVSPRLATRLLKPLRAWLTAIAIVLVVVAIALLLLGRFLSFGPASVFFGQPFHDALGEFSTTVPDGWKVTGGTGAELIKIVGGSGANEDYLFQDQQKGDTHATVFILVVLDSNPSCQQLQGMMFMPLYGIRAVSLPGSEPSASVPLSFKTRYALFNISVTVPTGLTHGLGLGGGESSVILPTPTVTDPTLTENQASSIISSMQVTGSC